MKKYIVFGVIAILAVSGIVVSQNFRFFHERLSGFEEVPAISTPGRGTFTARITNGGTAVSYRLSYDDTESDVTQAHIHFENKTNNGPIVVFLCSNLGNGPAGTQACPPQGGSISGTIDSTDVLTAGTSGIAAGEFEELLDAMRAGATYVNVHTVNRGSGEIRGQIDLGGFGFNNHDGDHHGGKEGSK